MFTVLRKSLIWAVAVAFAVCIVLFSVSNRGPVELDLWPLPLTQQVPVFVLILISVAFGILWGGFAAWLSAGSARKRAREATRHADVLAMDLRHAEERNTRLESDLKDLRAQQKTSHDLLEAPSAQRPSAPAGTTIDAA